MTDAAAITAAINAQFATPIVLTLKQSSTATGDYVNVFVSRRYVDERRASGEVTAPGGRVVTRYASQKEANIDVIRQRVTAALEDRILAGGVGPFSFETGDPVDMEGAWFVAADTWTY